MTQKLKKLLEQLLEWDNLGDMIDEDDEEITKSLELSLLLQDIENAINE